MPTIVKLGNIVIRMFADDHNPPHFHVVSGDRQAVLRIADLAVTAGTIAGRDYRQVVEWASGNRELLEHEWHRLNP